MAAEAREGRAMPDASASALSARKRLERGRSDDMLVIVDERLVASCDCDIMLVMATKWIHRSLRVG
jgi:hypothetical protein